MIPTTTCALLGTLLLASLASAHGGKTHQGTELFENGGFEQGLSSWRALNLSGKCAFEIDEKVKRKGKHSLRMEKRESGRPDFLKQSGDLESAAGSVVFSLEYRVAPKSRLKVDVYFFDAEGETVGPGYIQVVNSGKTRSFESASKEVEVPEGAQGFGVNAILAEPGSAWLDEVSAVQVLPKAKGGKFGSRSRRKESAFALGNGGFDRNLDGWETLEGGSGRAEASLDRRVKASGKGALKLERESPRLFPLDGVVTQLELPPKKRKVTLGFAAHASQSARAAVILQVVDENDRALATVRKELDAEELVEGFVEESLAIELPQGGTHITVVLTVAGRGSVWFDQLEIRAK